MRVFAEGSSVELSSTPVTVHVDLYGDGSAVEYMFETQFRLPTQGEASSRYVDFNVVLADDPPEMVDLRVSVADTPTRWSSDVLLRPPGNGRTLHLLLLAAETTIAEARVADGDFQTMALFSTGVVMAWLDPAGVALRIERVADVPVGRSDLVATDSAASKVRVASRPGAPSNVGPDLFALVWRGGDGQIRLLTHKDNDRHTIVDVGEGDDVQVAVAHAQSDYAVVTIIRNGGAARVFLHDKTGVIIEQFDLPIAETIRKLRGLVTMPDGGLLLTLETAGGWRLLQVDRSGAATGNVALAGETSAIALSEDAVLLHTAILTGASGAPLQLRSYYTGTLEPFTTEATTIAHTGGLPSSPFARISLAACGIVWPERRDDASDAFDLWVVDLDSAGMPLGERRLLNGGRSGVNFSPSVACVTSTRAYATFLTALDTASPSGNIMLRKVPPAPVQ